MVIKLQTDIEESDGDSVYSDVELNMVIIKVPTSVVRVTFPGQIIPERIEIEGLLLRTREFRRRVMFCDNCLKYNHTSKLCNNKQNLQKVFKIPCWYWLCRR